MLYPSVDQNGRRRMPARSHGHSLGDMTTPSIRRAYTDCCFGQLHYHAAAPAPEAIAAPTLVLLHQNPSSSVEYGALIEDMARDRRVYAFDTPGYGMSDRPEEAQSIASYAAAIGEGIRALGLDQDGPFDLYVFTPARCWRSSWPPSSATRPAAWR
jgi:pimeloyl-ACP methyl ester carboxylesterase